MHYALIIAGGSGTRLWPMSRERCPKQLLPFIGGKNLIQIASHRLEGVVPASNRYICAATRHEALIRQSLPELGASQYLGEPCGRDTLNAVGFSAAIIAKQDPDAIIAVFTADHIIEPVEAFIKIVDSGFRLVEHHPSMLVTFGITPANAATGYGYLQLGQTIEANARVVEQFKEKPDAATAQAYLSAGSYKYLWNSGMFVWRARTLLDCIHRYCPENSEGLARIAAAWGTPRQESVLAEVYPTLPKISVDFAIMEPASRDTDVSVAAIPMPLSWLDVGSWPAFAETCKRDTSGNAVSAKVLQLKSTGNLIVSSEPSHLITTVGCKDLIVIHTPEATLICSAEQAELVKEVQKEVAAKWGSPYV